MSTVAIRAARAFDRVLFNSTKRWDEAEACDAHWDGGEWSGPGWAQMWAEELERVTKLVAERFYIQPDELEDAILQRWAFPFTDSETIH